MSAVVLGALVILWAIVLVPMWLRRHDRGNEVASADRFAGAMRVLSRRPGTRSRHAESVSGARYVMTPARSSADHVPHVTVSETEDFEISGPSRYAALAAEGRRRVANTKVLTARFVPASVSDDAPAHRATAEPTHRRAPSRSELIGERARKTAQRRRLVLAMAASLVISVVMALLRGGVFVGLQVFIDILVLAGFAHLRAEVVAERARFRRAVGPRVRTVRVPESQVPDPARRRARPEPAVASSIPAPLAPAAAYEREPVRRPAPAVAQTASASGSAALAAARVMSSAIPVAPAEAVPDRPVIAAERSTPKTTAPAVRPPRSTRTVDLTQPGKWSERQTADAALSAYITGELVADQRAEYEEIERTGEFELDLILDRAVGE